jgi:hypothetical protein
MRKVFFIFLLFLVWRHDIQHNDTQHNDTQHNDTQHNDTQHNDTLNNSIKSALIKMTLSMTTLSTKILCTKWSVAYYYCCDKCLYAECHYSIMLNVDLLSVIMLCVMAHLYNSKLFCNLLD